ncbi:ABC transporter permease [Desulfopila aestuarii]|uniref:Nucleoside ABC transporter membrane protein n=1 Tax=Desulfopila aestuarii DSM 18488 TaxID=1121416 RepID=A0A1M7YIB9_9BACT|nr:ABC transporter permease [Desulfopila aestuarii]SHO52375.1 nucleoside ABC transporter membrane protein [Desulfopila aestuarii DSM 18488]
MISGRLKALFLRGPIGLTVVSIILGFTVGGIVLVVAGFNPFEAYGAILKGTFSKPKYIAYVIIYATPLIMTGLSVAFAMRTGLFNIGAEGQFIVGAMVAAMAGYALHLPIWLHVPLCLLLAMMAAALWGGLAGYIKARFGVHEVISTIMLNWTAFYLSNWSLTLSGFGKPGTGKSFTIQETARIDLFSQWKISKEGIQFIRSHEYLGDVLKAPVNLGIVVAIVLALLVWYILNRTTLGYELRAVGFNPHAAEYGGINVKRSIVTSMSIAGGLAGAAGALQVMGVSHKIAKLAVMEGYGFDGIAVALIGNNSGPGSVLAGFLFGGLKYGGSKIQDAVGAPTEVISIVVGTIILFIAMPKLIQTLLKFKKG